MPVKLTPRWEDLPEKARVFRNDAWGLGQLEYKLHDGQLRANTLLDATPGRLFVMDISRRWGKSYYALVRASIQALRQPRARIPYVAATKEMVRDIITPLMHEIIQDAPPDLRPKFKKAEWAWEFQNGSRIEMVGADHNPDSARGTHLDFGVMDEGAFIEKLEYILNTVLIPQMQGRDHAKILLLSTPPYSPLHSWSSKIVPKAVSQGYHYQATIEDNPLLSNAEREEFIELAGGRESINCRREYFAEHVVDEDRAIIPEFRRKKGDIVQKEIPLPPFYDAYVGMDPGGTDLWACLFAVWDFANHRLLVTDELSVERKTTDEFALAVRATEKERWGKEAYLRVSDTSPQIICDLLNTHNLYFQPTAKDDKRAQLNKVRLWVQQGWIHIHERCTNLIAHLEFGIWNEKLTDYARIEGYGHFDFIDALCYMIRNVEVSRNPYPSSYAGLEFHTHFISKKAKERDEEAKSVLATAFSGSYLRRKRG